MPHENVHGAEEHRDDVVHPLFDAGDLLHVLEVIEHVGIGDRKVDALQVHKVGHVSDRAVADDRQHAHVVAVIQRLAEIGGIL